MSLGSQPQPSGPKDLLSCYEEMLKSTIKSLALVSRLNVFPRPNSLPIFGNPTESFSLITAQVAALESISSHEKLVGTLLGNEIKTAEAEQFTSSFLKLHKNKHKIKKAYKMKTNYLDKKIKNLSDSIFDRVISSHQSMVSKEALATSRAQPTPTLLQVYQTSDINLKIIGEQYDQTANNLPEKGVPGQNSRINPEVFEESKMRHELIKELAFLRSLKDQEESFKDVEDYLKRRSEQRKVGPSKFEFDRKVSKDKKLKFDIFEPLVNFMSCETNQKLLDDRDEFIKMLMETQPEEKDENKRPETNYRPENNEDISLF